MAIVAAFAVPHPPLIIPEVGQGRELEIPATVDAYREVARRIAALRPDTVVISTPHSIMYRDYLHISPGAAATGDFGQFGVRKVHYRCEYDQQLVASLEAACLAEQLPAGTQGERDPSLDHATLIPVHFIAEAYRAADLPMPKFVRIGLSGLSPAVHYHLGMLLQKAASVLKRRVVYVASGDLSHKLTPDGPYGFAPEGPAFDNRIRHDFEQADFLDLLCMDPSFAERAAECGLRSFQIMAGALDRTEVTPELLSYEGPFGVGYGVATCMPIGAARSEEPEPDDVDPHIALARLSVETYVRTGRPAALPDDVPAELLDRRAGVFVSLHEHGDLRGCIGTISATTASVAEEILRNGICSCSEDPRFPPVREDELDYLDYSVDVLGDAEPIGSPDELDPHRYGVIVTKGWKRGLLLPNLDGVNTVEDQLFIAKQKAGLSPYDDDVQLERFEVVRHTRGGKPRKR